MSLLVSSASGTEMGLALIAQQRCSPVMDLSCLLGLGRQQTLDRGLLRYVCAKWPIIFGAECDLGDD